ncbi:D-cysteine desulfhydrase family protein [Sorangium sp. So ce1036]|uniref:D-cysteine desulfhydrase family protein n=1 Tax=Sorangium sp. So ce1036 TaxID=3133328 RepID=UPI003EFDCC72
MRKRLALAHLPTPIQRPKRLADAMGVDLYVKRDDMTAGPEAGNKIRKLEYLLAAAREEGADCVITCGGLQSNHARATALLSAGLGLRAVLYLRTADVAAGAPFEGNALLDRLAGAEVRLISPEAYRDREAVMAEAAAEIRAAGGRPYVIPEGGSNGLGALGYVRAMEEIRKQLDLGLAGGKPFDVIVHASSSGGTAAGTALGAARYGVAGEVRAMAVSDDRATLARVALQLMDDARALEPHLGAPAHLVVDDSARGPAYAVATPEQRQRIVQVARLSGLLLDPVYTGKAFAGLWDLAERGELAGKRVLFLHTGGLPGLLAQGASFADSM